ncbi:MAG: SgcJ/EcaC family oxidoreductase [Methyloceanibacter sp.]
MSEDEKAIRELVAAWMEASRTGDTDTVLSLMADDVVFMVPGREPFGKEEFAAAARGMTDLRIEGASDIQEIEVFGDWAYLRNRLTITMTPAGGEAMLRRSGYTLSILRKEKDGRWLLVRDANLLAIHE